MLKIIYIKPRTEVIRQQFEGDLMANTIEQDDWADAKQDTGTWTDEDDFWNTIPSNRSSNLWNDEE